MGWHVSCTPWRRGRFTGARREFAGFYHVPMSQPDECVFCRIIAGELPTTVVGQNDVALAFRDLAPAAPTHVLVIPRTHHPDLAALAHAEPETVAAMIRLAAEIADQEELAGHYRLVANTGSGAGQTVFHAHLHLLGGAQQPGLPG